VERGFISMGSLRSLRKRDETVASPKFEDVVTDEMIEYCLRDATVATAMSMEALRDIKKLLMEE
jgi:hypothetical protein